MPLNFNCVTRLVFPAFVMSQYTFCYRLTVVSAIILATPLLAAAQNAAHLERYVKAPLDTVRHHFGDPDAVTYSEAEAAEIWTYYHDGVRPSDAFDGLLHVPLDSSIVIRVLTRQSLGVVRARAGFTQFAFWNGHVAAASHAQTDEEAALLYDQTIRYLEERASWLGSGAGAPTHRITRLGDNTWTIYRTPAEVHVQTVLTIGDTGYLMCSKLDNSAERERVKQQFGVNLQQDQ